MKRWTALRSLDLKWKSYNHEETRMKRIGIILMGALCAPCSAMDGSELTKQIAYTALHIADWQQTRQIARDPRYYEKNLILGSKPTQAEVNRYMGATLIGHWAMSVMLKEEARRLWQDGTIVLEAATVHRNHRIGLSVRW